ncbi:MAG: Gldg family protein [Kofleriaceae bacterium]
MIWVVAKKELRGYFNSAVALIFLAAFLIGTLYTFFWHEKFFARGLADLRPLFEWMPKLLVILVSALAMRLWAEERRAGTLEVLLTLPVQRWKLVAGKFMAGMLLIAIALALTLSIPFAVGRMGNLDTGPVIGGYFATLLLAAAYLVIGMCVSAATDNQIVAFVGTALVCGITYVIGDFGAVWRLLGTGTRFESVARGVLDLRDLAYYASIVCVGFAINVLLLGRLSWGNGARVRARRHALFLTCALLAVNAIALNVWLSPVRRARIDLTHDGAYSLSSSTQRVVSGLDETLSIRGYFSEKTHPKLAPLIPQLRDLLEEYRIAGNGRVRVDVLDPSENEPAMREAKERFDIDPQPLQFATATEKSVVNAYFAIAIEYGDQHDVIKLDELIQVRAVDMGDIEITLRNPEYAITKAIKKAVTSFSSVDSLFASTPGTVKLTAYMTPAALPENWKDAPAKLQKVVDELKKTSGGKLAYETVEPKTEAEMMDLYQRYGLRPYTDMLSSGKPYYFALVLQIGDKLVRISPPENLGEAGLKSTIIDGLKRGAPGFTRVVGMWSPPAGAAMGGMGGMPQQTPPPQTFNKLKQSLSDNYEVRDIQLTERVPDDIEVLVLCGPANLDAKAVQAVDQFVMRGGALVVLAGRYRLAPAEGLAIEKINTGLEPVLLSWGITVLDQLVMDPKKNDSFPIPKERNLGNGMVIRELQQLPYPFFVKMDGDQLSASVITSGLPGSVMHFASPIDAKDKAGEDTHVVENLLLSSDEAYLTTSTQVTPELDKYATGFAPPTAEQKQAVQHLAVSVTGGFTSFSKLAKPQNAGQLLEHSPPDTRVVVFGSSAFVSDDVLGLAQQLQSDLALSNVVLVHNAVDWALADTDLLAIRAHTASARAITADADERGFWRGFVIVVALLKLGAIVAYVFIRRMRVTPVVTAKEVRS